MNKSNLEKGNDLTLSSTTIQDSENYRWMVNWVVLLSTVFLFGSALNCLFAWLSYGFAYDLAALVFSLILAVIVYSIALNPNRLASMPKRLLLSVTAMMIWAVFLPIVLRIAGFK